MVTYTYSAYGDFISITGILASTIGAINPFRYRSYYYDTDTNMYYLKTRYYNPEWCRFISSDNISYLEYDNPLGVNLFSYCSNNPVMYSDPEGKGVILALFLIVVVFVCLNCSDHDGNMDTEIELNYYENDDEIDNEKINYKIYKNTDDDVVIRIKDSYKITNSSIKRKILTEIINSEQGRLNNLSEEDLNYYMNEWACHNMGYRYPSIASLLNSDMTRNSALDSCRHVDLNKGDNKSKYYRLLGGLCEFFY